MSSSLPKHLLYFSPSLAKAVNQFMSRIPLILRSTASFFHSGEMGILLTPLHCDDRSAPARDVVEYHITKFAIQGDPNFHIPPSVELDRNWEDLYQCNFVLSSLSRPRCLLTVVSKSVYPAFQGVRQLFCLIKRRRSLVTRATTSLNSMFSTTFTAWSVYLLCKPSCHRSLGAL